MSYITPVIAIVGRPNVGKSTLFNALTKTKDALVYDMPGVTRDVIYGNAMLDDKPFILVDTGGIVADAKSIKSNATFSKKDNTFNKNKDSQDKLYLEKYITDQAVEVMKEADIVIFMVSAKDGLLSEDNEVANKLRSLGKKVFLAVNKVDGENSDLVLTEFFSLGFDNVYGIAAAHRRGITKLLSDALDQYYERAKKENLIKDEENLPNKENITKFAIIGRPNVGKSTLVNRILGEERVVVYDLPGTTRDSIYIPFNRNEKDYVIIDTAGIRKRGRIDETIEKFSVCKSLQSIKEADCAILLVNSQENITEQDLHLLSYAIQYGKSIIIACNKWDNLPLDQKEVIKRELDRRLVFAPYINIHFISALHGTGVGELIKAVDKTVEGSKKEYGTAILNRILEKSVEAHNPPVVGRHRVKLKYAHLGGTQPVKIVIHGNQVLSLPKSYKKYLINCYQQALDITGSPVVIEFRQGDNPFKDKPSELNARQIKKRQRMIAHRKSSKK